MLKVSAAVFLAVGSFAILSAALNVRRIANHANSLSLFQPWICLCACAK
jgi:hypothetical protein